MGDARRTSPSIENSREALLAVLRRTLPSRGTVLEIASGSGDDAFFFAGAFPGLTWQPSDVDPGARSSIAARVLATAVPNLRMPLELDATDFPWPLTEADAMLCIDLLHVAPPEALIGILDGARVLLPDGAPLIVHGPLRRASTPVRRLDEIDDALRSVPGAAGVPSLERVTRAAAKRHLHVVEVIGGDEADATVVLRRGRGG